MSSLDRQPIAKYNNMMRSIRKWESQINTLKEDINKLNDKLKVMKRSVKNFIMTISI